MKYFIIMSFSFFGFMNVISAKAEFPKNSIYQMQSEWLNQHGKAVRLGEYSGQKVLITMVYTSCPHACPLTMAKIKDILAASKNKYFKIVLVSFDPKRDTPKNNIKYLKKHKLDLEQWTILTAPSDSAVRELAVVLGINYQDLGDGDFSHSNVISILNSEGVLISKMEGFQVGIESVVRALNE